MNKSEFDKLIREEADRYVKDTLEDPEEHSDAAESIKLDFLMGAEEAWSILNY